MPENKEINLHNTFVKITFPQKNLVYALFFQAFQFRVSGLLHLFGARKKRAFVNIVL